MDERIYRLINIFALCSIILLGVVLRSFNLNFPSIGYHNMNENEYLTTAQQMKQNADYSLNRKYCYNIFEEPTQRYHNQPPLISYQVLLAWKLLDENLWGARLFNVLFGALSILVIYLIASVLFKKPYLSLSCSLLLAIMPMAVFFSRNIQPESPAFFFMVLANLFYLYFVSSSKKYSLFLSGLSLSMACLYKFNFSITLIPFIFCFPFKTFFKDRRYFLKAVSVFFLSLLPLIIAIIWLNHLDRWDFGHIKSIRPFAIFSSEYWSQHGKMLWWYMRYENYTTIYIITTLIGIITAFLKRKGLINRYILGWCASLFVYGIIYSEYIYQNSYSQMPFLILACVSSLYAVSSISDKIKIFLRKDIFLPLMLTVAIASGPFVYNSILRMHETVFLGVDVAGESLREFTKPDSYVFLSTHAQGYGIIRYSQRLAGWTDDLAEFEDKQERFDIKYACFYPIENLFRIRLNNRALYEYIEENYHIKEAGLTDEPFKLHYIILERGEGSDFESALQSLSGKKQTRTIYRTRDRYIFFYSLRPYTENAG